MSTPKPGAAPTAYSAKPLAHLPQEQREQVANEVLMRYSQGEQIKAMSPEYGVSHVSIYALLFELAEDAFRDAQVSRAIARHADALTELDAIKQRIEDAVDVLAVAKQRELLRLAEVRLKSAQWEMERLLRRLYGDAVPASAQGVVHVNIGLRRDTPATYDETGVVMDGARSHGSLASAR